MNLKVSEKQAEVRLKYYDRINDKLFSFNNFLMAAFIALTQIMDGVSNLIPLVPITNMLLLIYIDYRMSTGINIFIDKNNITDEEIKKENLVFRYIDFLLKLSIITTILVTVILLLILISGSSTIGLFSLS